MSGPWRSLLLLLTLACAACKVDVGALAPFPCGQDGTCPTPLVCTPHGCQEVVPGTPCEGAPVTEGGDVCAQSETKGLRCLAGVCADDCRTTCPEGQTCSALGGAGRACLVKCGALHTLCPTGSACVFDSTTGVPVCAVVPPAQRATCLSSNVAGRCSTCQEEHLFVRCADGSTCPGGSVCRVGGCGCLASENVVGCSTTRCDAGVCTPTRFRCQPPSGDEPCDVPAVMGSICRCRSGTSAGSTRDIPCGSTQSCETVCGLDCAAGERARCTVGEFSATVATMKCGLVRGALQPQSRCVPIQGQQGEGAPCTPRAALDGGALFGDDDCAADLVCHGPPGAGRCRRICGADRHCGGGGRCVPLATVRPAFGVCLSPGCGAGCAEGEACALAPLGDAGFDWVCAPAGELDAGLRCGASSDCARGLSCVGGACRAHCGASTPCAAGRCTPVVGTDAGVCL